MTMYSAILSETGRIARSGRVVGVERLQEVAIYDSLFGRLHQIGAVVEFAA